MSRTSVLNPPRSTQATPPQSLKFDRRASIRLPMSGVAMASFAMGHDSNALTGVEIVDTSANGIGIRSPIEVTPGTRFTLYPDNANWPAKSGVVSRCHWDGEYYRCGLNLGLAMAA